jgi:uncharacterized protein YlxW (UPF0749 family)
MILTEEEIRLIKSRGILNASTVLNLLATLDKRTEERDGEKLLQVGTLNRQVELMKENNELKRKVESLSNEVNNLGNNDFIYNGKIIALKDAKIFLKQATS